MGDFLGGIKDRPELTRLLAEAKAKVEAMSPEEVREMVRKQGESWARAEAQAPKPKYKWINGVKVYDSYSDYCDG